MSITQEFAVGAGAALNVKIQSGRVDVTAGTAGIIRLEVTSREPEDVDLHQAGDTVYVADNRSGWIVRGSVRIAAQVPPGTSLEVSSASADVYVDVDLATMVCRTASGDISFRTVASLEAKTASGAIRGDAVSGEMRVNSASGDVYVGRVGGRVTAALASGDVRVQEVGGDIRANSASGDLRIERFRGDDVNLKSVSGDLIIGFPEGITLDAEVSTLSGDVRVPSERRESSTTHTDRRRVRLTAKTVSGDVRISTFND